jgi:uncharacterized protein (DUF4213/DUF364 family)
MSRVIDEALALIEESIPNIYEVRAVRVCAGWGYVGVKLNTGHVGVCHSLLEEQVARCCRITERAGRLAGSPAIELARLAKSWDLSESVMGVAALNALSQMVLSEDRYAIEEGNFIDYIAMRVRATDTVAVVGNMKPLVDVLRGRVRRLYVFERSPSLFEDYTLPDTACEELLPEADVVVVTGTAIANKTIDRVLELSRGAREIGVVGPSAGMVPDPLFKRGVKMVGTIKPVDADRLIQIIEEGGGTPQIKPAVKFINVRPKT